MQEFLTEIIGFATSAGCQMESLLFAVTWFNPSRTGLSMRSSKLVLGQGDFVFIASRGTHEKDLESTSVYTEWRTRSFIASPRVLRTVASSWISA